MVKVIIVLVFIVQLPLLVDLLKFVFPNRNVSRITNKVSTFLLICFITSLFFIAMGYQLFVFWPLSAGENLFSFKGLLHLMFSFYIWLNAISNYYLAVFISPGTEPVKEKVSTSEGGPSASNGQSELNADAPETASTESEGSGSARERRKHLAVEKPTSSSATDHEQPIEIKSGMEWKPKTSHYCKVCEVRVRYMDHHCPFTGNCTGVRNFSYFFLFLVYVCIGLAYAFIVTLPYFRECVLTKVWWYLGMGEGVYDAVCLEIEFHSTVTMPILGGFCSVFGVLLVQVLLLLSDVSTYDAWANMNRMPVFRFMWQRICNGKFLDPDSRLNIVLLNQRPSVLWFLVPLVRLDNASDST